MSLTPAQRRRTGEELTENFRRCGLSPADVERDLGLSPGDLQAVLDMSLVVHPATTWLVRDYLDVMVRRAGGDVAPFTCLTEQMRPAAEGWFGLARLDDVLARNADRGQG